MQIVDHIEQVWWMWIIVTWGELNITHTCKSVLRKFLRVPWINTGVLQCPFKASIFFFIKYLRRSCDTIIINSDLFDRAVRPSSKQMKLFFSFFFIKQRRTCKDKQKTAEIKLWDTRFYFHSSANSLAEAVFIFSSEYECVYVWGRTL